MAANSDFSKHGPRLVIKKVEEVRAIDMEIVTVKVDSSVGTSDSYAWRKTGEQGWQPQDKIR